MAITISYADAVFNTGRQRVLDLLGKTPSSLGLRGIFSFLSIVLVFIIFNELRKGKEEGKKIGGPVVMLVFTLSMIFGFNIRLLSMILLIYLGVMLLRKIREGEMKGVVMMLIPMLFLGYLLSVNVYVLLGFIAITTALGKAALKRSKERTYGTKEAAKIEKEEGVPARKERKIIKGMKRIADRSYDWSKDKILREAGLIKDRFAEREARNLEEEEHEVEIAAAGKKLSETADILEKKETEIEEKDSELIARIREATEQLKKQLAKSGNLPHIIDTDKQKIILSASKEVLKDSNRLVEDKLADETLKEHANKIFGTCAEVIQKAAIEIRELHESKSYYKEIKKGIDKMIKAIEKEIERNTKGLDAARKQAENSGSPDARERIRLLEKRDDDLKQAHQKLKQIDGYTKAIIQRLMKINMREDEDLAQVDKIEEEAAQHEKKLQKFQKEFDKAAKSLKEEYNKYAHLFKEEAEEIPDQALSAITSSTVAMFEKLWELQDIAYMYTLNELEPMIKDMAQVAKELSYLSKTAEYLNKMYLYLSRAFEELTQMAEAVDQNKKSKNKMARILKTEELEEQITRRAYRKGKFMVRFIASGYKHLEEAYRYAVRHRELLQENSKRLKNIKLEVGLTLNEACRVTIRTEIKQAEELKKEAEETLALEQKARRFETKARRYERQAA